MIGVQARELLAKTAVIKIVVVIAKPICRSLWPFGCCPSLQSVFVITWANVMKPCCWGFRLSYLLLSWLPCYYLHRYLITMFILLSINLIVCYQGHIYFLRTKDWIALFLVVAFLAVETMCSWALARDINKPKNPDACIPLLPLHMRLTHQCCLSTVVKDVDCALYVAQPQRCCHQIEEEWKNKYMSTHTYIHKHTYT